MLHKIGKCCHCCYCIRAFYVHNHLTEVGVMIDAINHHFIRTNSPHKMLILARRTTTGHHFGAKFIRIPNDIKYVYFIIRNTFRIQNIHTLNILIRLYEPPLISIVLVMLRACTMSKKKRSLVCPLFII